jgi:hypothetical protein
MASAIRAEIALPLIRDRARRLGIDHRNGLLDNATTETALVGLVTDLIDVITQLTAHTEETP